MRVVELLVALAAILAIGPVLAGHGLQSRYVVAGWPVLGWLVAMTAASLRLLVGCHANEGAAAVAAMQDRLLRLRTVEFARRDGVRRRQGNQRRRRTGTSFRGIVDQDGVFTLADGSQLVVATAVRGAAIATAHPRAIALFPERPAGSPRNAWLATIAAVEPSFDSARIRLDGHVPLIAEVTKGTVDSMQLRPGLPIWVALKATEIAVEAE